MSIYSDQPFSENEERYFLAEIIKKSNLPPYTLINLIQAHSIEPAWNDIALPNGRSVASCQWAFANLNTRHMQQQQQQNPQQHRGPHMMEDVQQQRPLKRPYSMGDTTPSSVRDIQPRPPYNAGFPAQQQGPMTVEPPRKKRGRPTKAEHEKRSAEASARGEVWPKPRSKAKTRRTSEPMTAAQTRGRGSGSMEDSGEEASGLELTRPSVASSANTITSVMNSPTQNLSSNSRVPLQDIVQSTGNTQETTEQQLNSTPRSEPGLPFFQSQPTVPRLSGASHMQSFTPPMGHQFHPGGYRSPTSRQ